MAPINFLSFLSLKELCDWEQDDNIWIEHSKHTKKCAFLNMNQKILKDNERLATSHENKKETVFQKAASDDGAVDIESSCKICLNERANVVLLPCKHVAVCGKCVFGLKDTCPICREKITEKMSLFFA